MNNTTFQPMLSAKLDLDRLEDQLCTLEYPLIASPKVDGIRILVHPEEGPVTRKFKRVPNQHVYTSLAADPLWGLDGEVTVGLPHTTGDGTDVFNRTTAIMARHGEPEFHFHVFDTFNSPAYPYATRLAQAEEQISRAHSASEWMKTHIHLLPSKRLHLPSEVLAYEAECLEAGYEGIMLRNVNGHYKFGRSTLKQQGLIKLKRVEETEGTIIAIEPRYQNMNEQQMDNFGYARRSSHKENKIPLDMLGKFILKSDDFTEPFGCGSGFDHTLAKQWWNNRDQLLGKVVTFKYQKCGTLDKPRHPIFLRFRND